MCACTHASQDEHLPVFAKEPKACLATSQLPTTCYQHLFIVLPFFLLPRHQLSHSVRFSTLSPQMLLLPSALSAHWLCRNDPSFAFPPPTKPYFKSHTISRNKWLPAMDQAGVKTRLSVQQMELGTCLQLAVLIATAELM